MHRLLTILDTEARPSFIRKSELRTGSETQLFTGPLLNIWDANKNPLQMLDIIELRVYLRHRQIPLNFIICKTLAASDIIGVEFCDQHVKAVRPWQKIIEIDNADSTLTV